MVALLLLLLFSVLANGSEDCGEIVLEGLDVNDTALSQFQHCESVKSLLIFNTSIKTARFPKLVRISKSWNYTDDALLEIAENHELKLDEESFPQLKEVFWQAHGADIPQLTTRVRVRHNNRMCMAKVLRHTFLNASNEDAVLQPCDCVASEACNSYCSLSSCVVIHGVLDLAQCEQFVHSNFLYLKEIRGRLLLVNTTLEHINASFPRLQTVNCKDCTENNKEAAAVLIANNTRLRYVDLPALQKIDNAGVKLTFDNNTVLRLIDSSKVRYYALMKTSEPSTIPNRQPVYLQRDGCHFNETVVTRKNIFKLSECTTVNGELEFNEQSNDFSAADWNHLFYLQNIYGTLTIRNTTWRYMHGLRSITSVRCERGDCSETPVRILNNAHLRQLTFYGYVKFKSANGSQTKIQILNNPYLCKQDIESFQRMQKQYEDKSSPLPVIEHDTHKCQEFRVAEPVIFEEIPWLLLFLLTVLSYFVFFFVHYDHELGKVYLGWNEREH